jgi:flagellar protein FlaF
MQQNASYFRMDHLGGASPVESEILAFGLCNDRLAKATDGRSRIEALARNHQLWSLLVRDLGSEGNRLPSALKDQLIGIGLWAMAYSNLAIVKNISLQPLIEVNRNIGDGLRLQRRTPETVTQPAELRAPASPHMLSA